MQYAILIYEPETDFDARSDPERAASYRAPYETYVAMLLEVLDDLAAGEPRAAHYQPWWAVRADLLARAHLAGGAATASAAREAYERALALTDDPAVAAFLTAALSSLVSRTERPSRGASPGDGGASSGRPPCGSR
ncbi:MAG TPA: hypothetical protein RMF84_18295 [Polyangiaceae bacterium LLY-WYZ-14_1]|nr:hypothetical protein [Polyangiaceae bacterium LLY-WYZ-14_1]